MRARHAASGTEEIMSALTEWNSLAANNAAPKKQRPPLLYFLAFVFVLFIGILIFAYVVTKRTNPVYLDEHGKPVATSSDHSHH
jgi:hypothetical protein